MLDRASEPRARGRPWRWSGSPSRAPTLQGALPMGRGTALTWPRAPPGAVPGTAAAPVPGRPGRDDRARRPAPGPRPATHGPIADPVRASARSVVDLAPAFEGPAQGQLVGVFEVAAHRHAAGD